MSLIIGLGSPHGDDQLGWVAIDRLRPKVPNGVVAHRVRHGVELLEHLEGHERAVVIDAAAPTGRPGAIRSFVWPCPELALCASVTTHGLGLVEALQLAGALGRLPSSVIIHTIEARNLAPLGSLSADLATQVDVLVESILADLNVSGLRH